MKWIGDEGVGVVCVFVCDRNTGSCSWSGRDCATGDKNIISLFSERGV